MTQVTRGVSVSLQHHNCCKCRNSLVIVLRVTRVRQSKLVTWQRLFFLTKCSGARHWSRRFGSTRQVPFWCEVIAAKAALRMNLGLILIVRSADNAILLSAVSTSVAVTRVILDRCEFMVTQLGLYNNRFKVFHESMYFFEAKGQLSFVPK